MAFADEAEVIAGSFKSTVAVVLEDGNMVGLCYGQIVISITIEIGGKNRPTLITRTPAVIDCDFKSTVAVVLEDGNIVRIFGFCHGQIIVSIAIEISSKD